MPRKTLKRIHINQHVLKKNSRDGENEPVVTCKNSKDNEYGHEVEIYHEDVLVASVIYRPDKPLSCGAKCWVETKERVEVHNKNDNTYSEMI